MSEYNLNFFEAMDALKNGKTITSSESTMWGYRKNSIGDIVLINLVDTKVLDSQSFEFDSMEVQAKWRIVEPEPKCWLELEVEKFGFGSRGQKSVYVELGKALAKEAIKRIESRIDEDRPKSIDDAYCSLNKSRNDSRTECVNLLKDLIGEKQ